MLGAKLATHLSVIRIDPASSFHGCAGCHARLNDRQPAWCTIRLVQRPPHLRLVRLPAPFFGGALPRRLSLSSFAFFLHSNTDGGTQTWLRIP